jgi:protein HOOK3
MDAEKVTLRETISKQESKIQTLSEKMEGLANERIEVLRLKEQATEFTNVVEKLQRAEATIEKYKKKLSEAQEEKKAIPLLQTELEESNLKSLQLEEQFRKVAGLKPLIDTYKSQISALEERNSKLHLENVNFTFQMKEYSEKLANFEASQERDSLKLMELQDQLKDMELIGTL